MFRKNPFVLKNLLDHTFIFLHLILLNSQDIDLYKSSVKDDIDRWLKILGQYSIHDWMIVLVETYDIKKSNKLIPRTTVLDKIRSDFGSKHGDR